MRIKSIDIFRALTMLLMIFVNDLWTLSDIPEWLGHTAAHEDGMGLADVVLPAFLFIVGLSIPFAIKTRINRGESGIRILMHIAERTFALLVMGLFIVNLENISESQIPFSKYYWGILMTLSFFLIWNHYKAKSFGRIPVIAFRISGFVLLIFLAIIYRGEAENHSQWMRPHWWGILGLIGWGYLVNALVYFLLRDRPGWIALVCLFLYFVNMNEFINLFHFKLKIVVSASNHASVMSGMLVATILIRFIEKKQLKYLFILLLGLSIAFFLFGLMSRPLWGISKIRATPSWTAICAGINIVAFIMLFFIADRLEITRWAHAISPAGKSTLTCYLVPYVVYPLLALTGFYLPEVLLTGMAGIAKSVIFSLLIIWITGLLGRLNMRIRI